MTTTQVEYDRLALQFHPWHDDSDYRVMSNKMVVARIKAECAICFDDIKPGQRVRAQSETYDGKAMTFKFCVKCCNAMVRLGQGRRDIDELEGRYELGRRRCEQRRATA